MTPSIGKDKAEIAELNAKRLFHEENARVARILGDQEQLVLDGRLRAERKALAQDDQHFVYQFDDDVTPETVSRCTKKLMEWHRTDPKCNIEIQINSYGGDMFSGFRLIDTVQFLRRSGHDITTSVYGVAASMGAVILQAGTRRVAGKNAFILLHQGSASIGGSVGDIEDDQELLKKLQTRLLTILTERSKMEPAKLKTTWNRKNVWLGSDEALAHGFVDEVL